MFSCSNVFIFRHPKTVDSAKVFLAPFTRIVWLLIVVSAVIFTILIRKLLVATKDLQTINATVCGPVENDSSSYSTTFLMALGYLFQQGSDKDMILS